MEPDRVEEPIARVERLLEQVESLADREARSKATELVSAMLDLYGEGLDRIVERVSEHDDGALADALADDELISHLLLLHGLHPVPVAERVRGALDGVRPYLASHGGDVELLEVTDGIARLRLEGSCSGCPSSTMTLKLAIEDAIAKSAPDIVEVVAEGAVAPPKPGPQLIELEVVPAADGASSSRAGTNGSGPGDAADAAGGWTMAGGMPELAAGGRTTPLAKTVAGEEILFVELAGSLYAYRPGCPECGDPLTDATLAKTDLACPGCGNRYDVARAGRCLDRPDLHLEPVPLLLGDDGLVRVALGVPA